LLALAASFGICFGEVVDAGAGVGHKATVDS
jgi:hypothetical protein